MLLLLLLLLLFYNFYPRYLESRGLKAYSKNSWHGHLSTSHTIFIIIITITIKCNRGRNHFPVTRCHIIRFLMEHTSSGNIQPPLSTIAAMSHETLVSHEGQIQQKLSRTSMRLAFRQSPYQWLSDVIAVGRGANWRVSFTRNALLCVICRKSPAKNRS